MKQITFEIAAVLWAILFMLVLPYARVWYEILLALLLLVPAALNFIASAMAADDDDDD